MKKYLVSLIIIAITSITAFSRTSCEVYGQDGIKVELDQAIGDADKNGKLTISASLDEIPDKQVRVSITVYTISGCQEKTAPLMVFKKPDPYSAVSRYATVTVDGLTPGQTYQFSINEASCR